MKVIISIYIFNSLVKEIIYKLSQLIYLIPYLKNYFRLIRQLSYVKWNYLNSESLMKIQYSSQ